MFYCCTLGDFFILKLAIAKEDTEYHSWVAQLGIWGNNTSEYCLENLLYTPLVIINAKSLSSLKTDRLSSHFAIYTSLRFYS